jgi:hypothetical protein
MGPLNNQSKYLSMSQHYYTLFGDTVSQLHNSQSAGITEVLKTEREYTGEEILVRNVPNQIIPTKMYIMWIDSYFVVFYVVTEWIDKYGNLSLRFRLYVLTSCLELSHRLPTLRDEYRPAFQKAMNEEAEKCRIHNKTSLQVHYVTEG